MISGDVAGGFVLATYISYLIPLIMLIALSTGPWMLVIGGALLIWSMWKYGNAINDYLDKVETGVITPERAEKLIEIRSILTMIGNLVSVLSGKSEMFRYATVIIIGLTQYVVDYVERLFEYVERM